MSVPTQLERIKAAKADMISALTEQGVSVPSGASISNFGNYIRSIVKEGNGVDILSVYPIGSIYMSINSTSPATLFGGTWEQIKDTFLLSAGDTYAAGAKGGEATHILTVNEMPKHNHFAMRRSHEVDDYVKSGTNEYGLTSGSEESGIGYSSSYAGADGAHNNMPPYLAVYMWKRMS